MELSPKQQAVTRIKEAKKILILTHKDPDGDALGSSLALLSFFKNIGKEAISVCNEPTPAVFNFLPNVAEVSRDFAGVRDFVISLDTSSIKADKIMYKVADEKLNIIISPKLGVFSKELVSFPEGGFNFDLIIVLDSPDLERLGTPYEKNPDLFYEVPVINIDHHSGNDYFGQVNLVEVTATSTAEILVSLFEALSPDKSPFDENIATLLLTGIVTDTGSFQNTNTTPKSLTVAAQLVAAGAKRDEIIKNIYKTRPLSTLRLWGRALANIHDEKNYGFVWSTISANDFVEVGAAEAESGGVIDELLKTVSGAKFVLLLSEKGGILNGSLRSIEKGVDVSAIAKLFNGGGHAQAAGFEVADATLADGSSSIIQKIREYTKQMNGKLSQPEAGK